MKVSIIGSGNGGLTIAYWIAKNGNQVLVADDEKFSTQINAINSNGGKINAPKEYQGIKLKGLGEVNNISTTTSFEKAVKFSNILIMVCPSFAQEILFAKLLPHLTNEHILVSLPGNYASLVLTKYKNDNGYKDLDVTFVDGISIPFACRIINPAEIAILGIKKYLSVSIYPSRSQSQRILNDLSDIFSLKFNQLPNPIVVGLENINYGGHPLMTISSIALLENFNGKFNFYKDCCSPATAAASEIIDQERLSIGKAYGWKLLSELEALNGLYDYNSKSVYEFNTSSVTHGKLNSSPNSSKHRYISEDVPYLLVPSYEIAKKAGLELKVTKSVITIAGAFNGENYFEKGRNLKKLGLDELSFEEIKGMFS